MKQDDIARQHEFNQDLELYGLDNDYPHVSPLEKAQLFYDTRSKSGENFAPFAIEADGKYIGHCALMRIQHPHRNFGIGIMIGDRDYWGRGYGRETINLLLHYGFHYLGARRIEGATNAKNVRAIRCYLSCGLIEEGRLRKAIWIDGEYTDIVEMAILQDEWFLRNKSSF